MDKLLPKQLEVQRQLDEQARLVSAGGVKFDGDKPRMDLLDACAIEQLAQVLTFGASKYAAQN